jgi:hypothetical protein
VSNPGRQPLPEAGAQRMLEAVGCSSLLGITGCRKNTKSARFEGGQDAC